MSLSKFRLKHNFVWGFLRLYLLLIPFFIRAGRFLSIHLYQMACSLTMHEWKIFTHALYLLKIGDHLPGDQTVTI